LTSSDDLLYDPSNFRFQQTTDDRAGSLRLSHQEQALKTLQISGQYKQLIFDVTIQELPMETNLNIRAATLKDKEVLADIIQRSYQTVARSFNLTPDNCPRHPSNCTPEWIAHDLDRGVAYFLLSEHQYPVGCAALERADERTCYLERLAVLPEYRHNGQGEKLVNFIIEKARIYKADTLGIGIIEEQAVLKKWYEGLGFTATGTRKFDHLPFTVGFLQYDLS
jgi:GNAT superfamily N-acetyltransferase